MRGKLRERKLTKGRLGLYIDYYPPVWNSVTKRLTRRENLKLTLYANPQTTLEQRQNALHKDIAEKIYIKRMKSLMLDEHKLFNIDVLQGDFYVYAKNFIIGKEKAKNGSAKLCSIEVLCLLTGQTRPSADPSNWILLFLPQKLPAFQPDIS